MNVDCVVDKNNKHLKRLEENILVLLDCWVTEHANDFHSSKVRKQVLIFTEKFSNHKIANQIKLKLLSISKKNSNKSSSSSPSLPDIHKEVIDCESSLEIAASLTYLELLAFNKIQASELRECGWTKEQRDSLSPNLVLLSNFFDKITKWVSQSILLMSDKKIRVKRIQKFLEIIQKLLKFNNYQSAMAIFSGLSLNSVDRLKDTWDSVPNSLCLFFDSFSELMSPTQNYSNYRKVLKSILDTDESCSTSFAVPYIPLILRDVTYLYESPSSLSLNEESVLSFGQQIHIIKTLQLRSHLIQNFDDFHVKESLVMYFQYFMPADKNEDELYSLSHQIEPAPSSSSSSSSASISNPFLSHRQKS